MSGKAVAPMSDDLLVILMDLCNLSESALTNIEQVMMLDVDSMPQPEKDKRLEVLRSIQITQDGCKKTFARIEVLHRGAVGSVMSEQ